MNEEISNAEIYRKLNTVDNRTAKLQSDVNDIKVVQATDHQTLTTLSDNMNKINRTVYGGNGAPGLIARVGKLEDKEVLTWKDTAKELLLPLAMGFLGYVLANLA